MKLRLVGLRGQDYVIHFTGRQRECDSYSPSDSHIHTKQLDLWEIIFNFSPHTMVTAKCAKTHIRQHISIGNTKT